MEFEKSQVESSVIESIGYNSKNKTLRVWIKGNGAYDYFSVPESRFKSFLEASSKGEYYNKVIKKLYKEYVRIEDKSRIPY